MISDFGVAAQDERRKRGFARAIRRGSMPRLIAAWVRGRRRNGPQVISPRVGGERSLGATVAGTIASKAPVGVAHYQEMRMDIDGRQM